MKLPEKMADYSTFSGIEMERVATRERDAGLGNGGAQLALDRALARLDGPPREGRAVIREDELGAQTSSR